MYGFAFQQYNQAYPELHYQQPPCAANGYGWHGNGYGWQIDPANWRTPSLYPKLEEVVEEPQLTQQKVEKQAAAVSKLIKNNFNKNNILFYFNLFLCKLTLKI